MARIPGKRQITIPRAVRDAAGLGVGDNVVVEARDAEVIIRKARGVLEFEPPAFDREGLSWPDARRAARGERLPSVPRGDGGRQRLTRSSPRAEVPFAYILAGVEMRAVVLMFVCIGLVLSGCGDSEQASSPQTVTVVERTVTAEAPAEEPAPAPETAQDEEPSTREGSGGSGSSGKIRVPNVVGKDHQLAQDTMQEAGLYSLVEEDATGQDRVLLIDRNWTVVSQSPKAGTRVSEDRMITLRSKKDGE